jgi:hypothetical protein
MDYYMPAVKRSSKKHSRRTSKGKTAGKKMSKLSGGAKRRVSKKTTKRKTSRKIKSKKTMPKKHKGGNPINPRTGAVRDSSTSSGSQQPPSGQQPQSAPAPTSTLSPAAKLAFNKAGEALASANKTFPPANNAPPKPPKAGKP